MITFSVISNRPCVCNLELEEYNNLRRKTVLVLVLNHVFDLMKGETAVKEWGVKELRLGEILAVSLQTLMGSFGNMLLISLICWAPVLVISVIDISTSWVGVPFLMAILTSLATILSMAAVMIIDDNVRQEKEWDL